MEASGEICAADGHAILLLPAIMLQSSVTHVRTRRGDRHFPYVTRDANNKRRDEIGNEAWPADSPHRSRPTRDSCIRQRRSSFSSSALRCVIPRRISIRSIIRLWSHSRPDPWKETREEGIRATNGRRSGSRAKCIAKFPEITGNFAQGSKNDFVVYLHSLPFEQVIPNFENRSQNSFTPRPVL